MKKTSRARRTCPITSWSKANTPPTISSTFRTWSTSASGPSMYIGDTTLRGLHHLVYEVVDNSIDEAMAGHATTVTVMVNADGSVTVEDDGRGIPVERHAQLSEEMDLRMSPRCEGVMTVLKFGGKFEKGRLPNLRRPPRRRRHRRQLPQRVVPTSRSTATATSTIRNTSVASPPARSVSVGSTTKRGTKTTFKPDPQIFPVRRNTSTPRW